MGIITILQFYLTVCMEPLLLIWTNFDSNKDE